MILRPYSYREFQQDTEKLARIIRNIEDCKNKRFTKVYGVPRGGLMLAIRLSHLLNIPLVVREEEIDQNTLVCEDIISTGATFRALVQKIGFAPLIATLFFVDSAEGLKDVVFINILEDNNRVWIRFPWETEESTFS